MRKKILRPSFEESIEIIDSEIQKRKHRWHLTAISWMDFEDVSQKLKLHIYKKWVKWDASRPLRPWLNQVINHQMTNMIRNYYSNFSRPCLKCKFNMGENNCAVYGLQNSQCKDYSKWEKNKKPAYDIKFPISIHTPISDIPEITLEHSIQESVSFFDIDKVLPHFHELMKKNLTVIEWKVYDLLFLQNLEENEVASKMGYKLSLKEGRPAYRQIGKIKSRILQKARILVKEVI
jgi:hypothetical protein